MHDAIWNSIGLFSKKQSFLEKLIIIVSNKNTKEPYPDLPKKLGGLYNKYNMIGLPSPVGVTLAPPITVNKDEIDDLVERVENIIKDLETN